MNKRASFVAILVLALAALLAFSMPALAHHKDDHEQGGRETAEEGSTSSSSEQEADSEGSTRTNEHSDDATDDNDDNAHPSGKDRETHNGSTDDVQGGDRTSNPDNDGRGPERSSCDGTSGDTVGGCADKPGGTGGVDQDDQDWNNGCGNDDDFEDDNEGWCGRRPAKPAKVSPVEESKKVCPAGSDLAGQEMKNLKDCDTDDVLGSTETLCPATTDRAGLPMDELKDCDRDDVLGGTIKNPTLQVRTATPSEVLGTRFTAGAPAQVAAEAIAAAAPSGVLPFTGAGLVPFLLIGLAMIGSGFLVARRSKA